MARYIAKRLLFLIPIMFIVSLISFFLIYLSPGDPARIFLAQSGDVPSAEAIEQLREQLGLNAPIAEQYVTWIKNILRGDFGVSISTGRPVINEIAQHFSNTLWLTALSMLFTLVISIPLGVLSAVKENKIADNIIRAGTFVTSSLPGFFAALLLIYFLGIRLKWLPTISTGSSKGIILPSLTLAITLSASYIRQIRASLVKELSEEYIQMARARGIRERIILYGGALKSAMPSILTIAGINIGHLLGGTAIIEMVCTYPGIGRLAVKSITTRDYPMVQGYTLMMAVIYVLINLCVDILHALADPRVKHRILTEERAGRLYGKKSHLKLP